MTEADDPVPAVPTTETTTTPVHPPHGRSRSDTAALYVRVPVTTADRLDRAVFELRDRKVTKQDIVTALIERFVDASTPSGAASLRELLDSYQTSNLPT